MRRRAAVCRPCRTTRTVRPAWRRTKRRGGGSRTTGRRGRRQRRLPPCRRTRESPCARDQDEPPVAAARGMPRSRVEPRGRGERSGLRAPSGIPHLNSRGGPPREQASSSNCSDSVTVAGGFGDPRPSLTDFSGKSQLRRGNSIRHVCEIRLSRIRKVSGANTGPRGRWVSGLADGAAPFQGGLRRGSGGQLRPPGLRPRNGGRLPRPDRVAAPQGGLLGGGLGETSRRLHWGPDRRGLRLRHGGQLPAGRRRPLRRAAQRPVLHGRPQACRLHTGQQRRGHAEPALCHSGRGSVDPPRQVGDDGGVRHPQHRYRRGLHRDHPPGPDRRPALPEAAREAFTTCPRSTTATTSRSAAGSGASARPTSTRGSSTGSRPPRPPCTPTWRPASTTTPSSVPC